MVNQSDQTKPVLDLDTALPSGSHKPRMIALYPAKADDERMATVNSPYTAVLNLPIKKEQLLRAVHFAAQEPDGANERRIQKDTFHSRGKSGAKPRVLVAEDNPTNRKIIAQILEYGGYDVSLSTTGTQALEDLQHSEFDVVILDKHMPGMSGLEVATRYLDMRGAAAAPMIMLTAEATAEAMQECKAAGMKAFLTKPIDPDMLFETINALTGIGDRRSDISKAAATGADQTASAIIDESVLTELDKHAYSSQFIVAVVESFESDMQDLIERLQSAISTGNWPVIPDILHTMEGTARSSGATAIVSLARKFKSLDTITPDDQQGRIAELRACVSVTMDAMKRFLAKRSGISSRDAEQATA